jgi:hypothetical protein
VNNALHPVITVDDLLRLDPLDRLEALIGGANFAPFLREEPITFDMLLSGSRQSPPGRYGGAWESS